MTVKAKESVQIRKAREKIKRHMDEAEQKINPEALSSMRKIIQKQIARHQGERINLKERLITLFDENRHSAKTESKFVLHLLQELQAPSAKKAKKRLGGRIKSIE